MRVFVLTTGRSGSHTLAAALSHATNYTVGHETRNHLIDGRLDYPDQHIEIDNRLQWFTGPLAEKYPDARYVHLTRPTGEVVNTYLRLWPDRIRRWTDPKLLIHPRRLHRRIHRFFTDPFSLNRSLVVLFFAYGIIRSHPPYTPEQRAYVSRLAVETMNANIAHHLRDKPSMIVSTENFQANVARLWAWIGAEGDLDSCLAELGERHNSTVSVDLHDDLDEAEPRVEHEPDGLFQRVLTKSSRSRSFGVSRDG